MTPKDAFMAQTSKDKRQVRNSTGLWGVLGPIVWLVEVILLVIGLYLIYSS